MKRFCLLVVIVLMISCSKTPEPINYGTDMCHFCQMTIVTKTHSAQMVTDKGKQFKFDAIDCIVHFLQKTQELFHTSQLLITDYNSPGTMIDAKSASFLVSAEIKSPMGANLTGFDSIDVAKKMITDNSANFFDWNGIFTKLN